MKHAKTDSALENTPEMMPCVSPNYDGFVISKECEKFNNQIIGVEGGCFNDLAR